MTCQMYLTLSEHGEVRACIYAVIMCLNLKFHAGFEYSGIFQHTDTYSHEYLYVHKLLTLYNGRSVAKGQQSQSVHVSLKNKAHPRECNDLHSTRNLEVELDKISRIC